MPTEKKRTKEIHREIDYEIDFGPNKIHLILQVPFDLSDPFWAGLRQEILTILGRELSGKDSP